MKFICSQEYFHQQFIIVHAQFIFFSWFFFVFITFFWISWNTILVPCCEIWNAGLALPHTDAFFMRRVVFCHDAWRRDLDNVVPWHIMYLAITLGLNHATRKQIFSKSKIKHRRSLGNVFRRIVTQRNATHKKTLSCGAGLEEGTWALLIHMTSHYVPLFSSILYNNLFDIAPLDVAIDKFLAYC